MDKKNEMNLYAWSLLLILCGAIFLEGIDVAMLNVALPSIRNDLGMSTTSLSWVISSYVIGYGGFMLLGGRAADLLGRRKMFLIWLFIFILFSGLGGFATEGWVLILARFVTGIAAAFMAPAGLSIITTSFPEGPLRNRALMFYAGTAAAGFSLGLVIGGLLSPISWRWVFYAPVILAIMILIGSFILIPKKDDVNPTNQTFDLAGALSITGSMMLLIFSIVQLGEANSDWRITLTACIIGFILFITFLLIERKSKSPLVRLGILRSGSLLRANLSALLFASSFSGFQFIVVLYLQELRGWSQIETGLAMLVIGIDAILAPTLTPWLIQKLGTNRVIFGGLLLAALSYTLFQPIELDWTYKAMFPSFIILGLSFALTYGPLTIAATDGIEEKEQGLASSLLYTSFQFGAALGLSIVITVSVTVTGANDSPQAILEGYQAALLIPLNAVLLGGAVTFIGLFSRKKASSEASE
ncbi:Major Facilitator Superfamily protein [Seinonella peptonophila]|uniref:Major Facilitator Superfamily protein n=1 Tax=Seinonella peptonophila TaxID=112248 RepID=A0A1M4WMZ0_9BACL|nr:MFS transporter [Seinonella peptonophila]SHE82619.1 Major Facilitator Superfamily protein [Seinonella peptonophila]